MVIVRGSGGSCNRAIGYHPRGPGFDSQSGPSQIFIASLCPPGTKWVARSLKTRQKRRRRGKQCQTTSNAVLQEQSGPYSWFPEAWIKRRTHFTFNGHYFYRKS
ncbi:hypothetical protein PoB_002611600 [Plakobranchus ocellatus]|uniref:Uncharacterized protein n=1 Tax=Plakobranchus ocellatus TaxID=259542 RepID=A0AAV3ZYK1_9GAST|nr:hypothetical protein PoB_002611600 [Plakobranchus ocellatus]